MKTKNITGSHKQSSRALKAATLLFLAAFVVIFSTQCAVAQGFKMTQLNAPGNTNGTFPNAVNTGGAVVGTITDSSGNTDGFLYSGGKYTALDFPGASGFTRAIGINDSGTVVGDFYESSDNAYHGYTYKAGVYTQYDVDLGKVSTSIFGINSAGDFTGPEGAGDIDEGYTTIGGTVTEFYASGTDSTFPYAINSADEVVGLYLDSS